ncbi:MAG: hypothetical protein P1U61_03340 [Legionellaceae bacterium]|nr:hypothetical protein [Legionellaceae bacterium]
MSAVFVQLISDMRREKIIQMTQLLTQNILSSKENLMSQLRALYSQDDPEYHAFQAFLDEHTFCYLGGNNSKNFVVKNKLTREAVVLKVENRKGMSNDLETRLRSSSVSDVLTDVFAEREANYTTSNGVFCQRSLLITEYCKGLDVGKHGCAIANDRLRLASALTLHVSMSDFLEKLQDEHAVFPDMKSANWLVDETEQIKIADTKSFLEMSSRQKVWFRHGLNEHAPLLATTYMNPPELKYSKTKAFSGDKMHAYMLGKSLYQYVTRATPHIFYGKDKAGRRIIKTDASELDFTHAVFEGEAGLAVKQLIQDVVKNNPDERISLAETHARLASINAQYTQTLHETSVAYLAQLEALYADSSDVEMKRFIGETQALMSREPVLMVMATVEQQLKSALDTAEALSSDIQALQDAGMGELAHSLKDVMAEVPVEDREQAKLSLRETPEAAAVMHVLHLIDEQKALKSVQKTQDFKQTLAGERGANDDAELDPEEPKKNI